MTDNIPSFLSPRPAGKSRLGNLDRSDYIWPGEDESAPLDRSLMEVRVFAPERIAKQLLVVLAQALSQPDAPARSERAFAELGGGDRANGHPKSSDDDLLTIMGDRYFLRRFRLEEGSLQSATLAKLAIESCDPKGRANSTEALIKRLVRKFNQDKDFWISSAQANYDPELRPRVVGLQRATELIKFLIEQPLTSTKAHNPRS